MDEKVRVLFAMYDLNGENSVNREELAVRLLLNASVFALVIVAIFGQVCCNFYT